MEPQHESSVNATQEAPANHEECSQLVSQLRQENELLRHELHEVLDIAAANEAIWRQFFEIEKILFCTRHFEQLVEELLQEIKSRFQIDWAMLFLVHPDLLERFFPELTQEGKRLLQGTWVLPLHVQEFTAAVSDFAKPSVLQPGDTWIYPWLPGEVQGEFQSGVWIPLTIHQMLFGTLLLGSRKPERYHSEDSTDLLEQLGAKIALCMDNCLVYEKIKDLSVLDPLTGLPNLFQVQARLEMEFRKARRHQLPLTVLLIDLDLFQKVNDDFGQQPAAAILRHAADLLQTVCRTGDALGRYGSDEFILVLPGTDEEEAQDVVDQVRQVLRKSPFMYRNTAILLYATIGQSSMSEATERSQDLLADAATELYCTKFAHHWREHQAPS